MEEAKNEQGAGVVKLNRSLLRFPEFRFEQVVFNEDPTTMGDHNGLYIRAATVVKARAILGEPMPGYGFRLDTRRGTEWKPARSLRDLRRLAVAVSGPIRVALTGEPQRLALAIVALLTERESLGSCYIGKPRPEDTGAVFTVFWESTKAAPFFSLDACVPGGWGVASDYERFEEMQALCVGLGYYSDESWAAAPVRPIDATGLERKPARPAVADVQLAVSCRDGAPSGHEYRVWKSSIDDRGRYTYCGTASLEVARAFAAKWVGPTPTLGTDYAVCDWGVSKVEVEGLTLAELFPALGGE